MNISAIQLHEKLTRREKGEEQFLLLDVRNKTEQDICTIPGTDILIPVKELNANLHKLNDWKQKEVVVYCKSGIRSKTAENILKENGFEKITHLSKGILEYIETVDSEMAWY